MNKTPKPKPGAVLVCAVLGHRGSVAVVITETKVTDATVSFEIREATRDEVSAGKAYWRDCTRCCRALIHI